jgi:hypothetical protein
MEASMPLKGRMSQTILNVSLLALDLSLLFYLHTPSVPGKIGGRESARLPATAVTKVNKIKETSIARSVAVEDEWAFPIVQQPQGEPNYVSTNSGELTLFSSASKYGNIGLLAHNYLSGKSFTNLSVGQEIRLVYEDGESEYFVVSEILQYQALDPENPFSSFQNIKNKNEILTAQQMFERVYEGQRHITFQTCIAKYGESSWGRLFVVALPETASLSLVH